jgi:hypothetical protein
MKYRECQIDIHFVYKEANRIKKLDYVVSRDSTKQKFDILIYFFLHLWQK